MLNDPPNLNALWAAMIVEELVRNGVDTFCISPGSRSTPLTMAVATGGPLRSVVHFDERGTAFHALGHAKATGRPAVYICTSGTAAANALPAVVEARESCVPLILLTADRPPEMIDSGANQTIDQVKLFGDYVRWYHALPCPDLRIQPAAVLTALDQAVYRATRPPAGPVHINCAFREPLAPDREPFDSKTYTQSLASWFDGPYTAYARPSYAVDCAALEPVMRLLTQTRRGVLLVGQLHREGEIGAARTLIETLKWPVFADVTSGLRLGPRPRYAIDYYDALLRSRMEDELATAQVVLHVGGPMTSKEVLRFLDETPSRNYVRVANHDRRVDPAHRVSHRLEMGLAGFAEAVARHAHAGVDGDWLAALLSASEGVREYLDAQTGDSDAVTEVSLPRILPLACATGSLFFLGNSMPIRDADAFGARGPHEVLVAANRGASGIDGNLATAAGYAAALRRPTTAIVGDLAALHDMNSLALVKNSPAPVIVVIINNDGGGIFSFLPIAEHPKHFERFFGTPHGLRFDALAAAFSLPYAQPRTNAELREVYREFAASGESAVIEVVTERRENEALHRRLRNELRQMLDKAEGSDY